MEAPERIQCLQLNGGGQERLLIMLTMDINQGTPELLEQMHGTQIAVEEGPMTAGARQDPSDDDLRLAGPGESFGFQGGKHGMIGRKEEGGFEVGLLGVSTDVLTRGSAADEERDGIDEK